jgi:hypothetical protein
MEEVVLSLKCCTNSRLERQSKIKKDLREKSRCPVLREVSSVCPKLSASQPHIKYFRELLMCSKLFNADD